MDKNAEVLLSALTYGGDAIGRLADGRAVFLPFGLPGERVRVRLVEEKRGFARAELVEVIEASPQRIAPKCRHFGICGGCHYQHMPYEAQLRAKESILRDQLERIGKIGNPPLTPIVPSPVSWNYRNHVQFHLTEDGKIGYAGAGLNEPANAASQKDRPAPTIVPISECHLPEPSINAFWPQLEFEPGTNLERVSLRLGTDEELLLVLESDDATPPELEIEAGISAVHLLGENAVVLAGDDHILIRVLDRAFRVSAASFFQVNTAVAGKMVEHLLGRLPPTANTILDVYCGVGLFSAFLAPRCGRLIGIESSRSACEDFAVNLDEFDNVELYEATAEEVLPVFTGRTGSPTYPGPDLVLVDPPRAGLDRRALDAIVALGPGALAYVSCDPSTLARDAARLIKGGYRLVEVAPFDLFPQTYHIESVSIFEKP